MMAKGHDVCDIWETCSAAAVQASDGVVFIPIKDRLVLSMIFAEAKHYMWQTVSILIGNEGNVTFRNPFNKGLFLEMLLEIYI